MSNLDNLLLEINTLTNDISNYEKLIVQNKRLIKQKKKELYNICQHDWVYDECSNWDDRCKYKCKFCNLWRNNNYN